MRVRLLECNRDSRRLYGSAFATPLNPVSFLICVLPSTILPHSSPMRLRFMAKRLSLPSFASPLPPTPSVLFSLSVVEQKTKNTGCTLSHPPAACLDAQVSICMHSCIHTLTRIWLCIFMQHAYTYIVCAKLYEACMHACMHAFICTNVCPYFYTCIHMHWCVCTYASACMGVSVGVCGCT